MRSPIRHLRHLRHLFLVVLCLSPLLLHAQDRWSAERAQLRQHRATLREQAAADVARRASDAADAIHQLISHAESQRVAGQDNDIASMIRGLRRLDPEKAQALSEQLATLEAEPEESTRMEERTWQRQLDRAKRSALSRTGTLLNRAIDMSLHDLAHGFLIEILAFDPDNAGIRRGLGQVQVEGRWLTPHQQQMARQGLWWDEKLGWIVARDAERYADGEYFDLQSRSWTTLEQANQRRSELDHEWVINTGNIQLHTTLDLQDAIAMVTLLEEFYAGIFAAYAGFFTSGRSDYRLIMGMAEHDPLVIWIYRDRDQFRSHALARRANAPDWSAGFWSPRDGASFFYGTDERVMFHEFTHQIFHIFAGGNRAPVWITEGVAIYSETPAFVDGLLHLGSYDSARRVQTHRNNARQQQHRRINDLLNLDHQRWSGAQGSDVHRNYDAAGALTWFWMEADDRRYRADFVDYVRDAYRNQTRGRQLWDYLGMSRAAFIQHYQQWETAED